MSALTPRPTIWRIHWVRIDRFRAPLIGSYQCHNSIIKKWDLISSRVIGIAWVFQVTSLVGESDDMSLAFRYCNFSKEVALMCSLLPRGSGWSLTLRFVPSMVPRGNVLLRIV